MVSLVPISLGTLLMPSSLLDAETASPILHASEEPDVRETFPDQLQQIPQLASGA